jgi:putative ABC transport system ATP-binding protein
MTIREEILAIRDLAVGYESILLRGVSFSLHAGERVLLSGPSGCGKSSLLRAVLGLLAPAGGEIRIGGRPIGESSVWLVRRQIGYVPQEPDLGTETLRSFFERAFSFHANRDIRPSEKELSDQMDRWLLPRGLLDKSCQDLSGGEKQRAAIILAILLKRAIVLLDEPTSALDKASREILYSWLKKGGGPSFLIVSHDPPLATMADQVIDLSPFMAEAAYA